MSQGWIFESTIDARTERIETQDGIDHRVLKDPESMPFPCFTGLEHGDFKPQDPASWSAMNLRKPLDLTLPDFLSIETAAQEVGCTVADFIAHSARHVAHEVHERRDRPNLDAIEDAINSETAEWEALHGEIEK